MNLPSAPVSAEDAEAIRNLIAEFHYLIDRGRASDCMALLAPDATLIFGPGSPKPGSIEGLDAIRDFLDARQAALVTTRHLLGQARLETLSPERVVAASVLTLFKSPSEGPTQVPAVVADLEEVYVRTAEGWRLSVREVRPINWG